MLTSEEKTQKKLSAVWFIAMIVAVLLTIMQMKQTADKNLATKMAAVTEIINAEQKAKLLLEETLLKERIRHTQLEGELATLKKQAVVKDIPYKPEFQLTAAQNKLCLAIGMFTEVNGEPEDAMENIGWGIMNRVEEHRPSNHRFANNACAVLVAKDQYSGMGPYIVDIKDVVWGRIVDFIPALAKKNEKEMIAWEQISKIADDIIDGKLSRKTTATHFISWRSMASNTFPNWVRWLMPIGTKTASGLHTLFRDYGYDRETGEKVIFTKANPYNPKKHRS